MFVAWIYINVTSYHKLVSIIILLNEYYDFRYDDVHFHLLLYSKLCFLRRTAQILCWSCVWACLPLKVYSLDFKIIIIKIIISRRWNAIIWFHLLRWKRTIVPRIQSTSVPRIEIGDFTKNENQMIWLTDMNEHNSLYLCRFPHNFHFLCQTQWQLLLCRAFRMAEYRVQNSCKSIHDFKFETKWKKMNENET